MTPLISLILGLCAALFVACIAAVAYAQMRIRRSEEDGFMRLRREIADAMGMGDWADAQNSLTARRVSFVLASVAVVAALGFAAWNGWLLLSGG